MAARNYNLTDANLMARVLRTVERRKDVSRRLFGQLVERGLIDSGGEWTADADALLERMPGGYVEAKICKATGHQVTIYESEGAGWDTGKYVVVCEKHSETVIEDMLTLARKSARYPEWCMACQSAMDD